MASAGLLVLLLALALAASACSSSADGREVTTARPGGATSGSPGAAPEVPAPEISGVTLDGRPVSLSDYRGKALVLAFMASW